MTDGAPEAAAATSNLDATLGVEWLGGDDQRARAAVTVGDHLRQPFGLVHGGVFASIAESLASRATYEAVAGEGMVAMGLSNHTSFLRPVTGGRVESEARRRHRGRTTWLWEVDHSDDEGRLCAVSRVTIAVRPAPQT